MRSKKDFRSSHLLLLICGKCDGTADATYPCGQECEDWSSRQWIDLLHSSQQFSLSMSPASTLPRKWVLSMRTMTSAVWLTSWSTSPSMVLSTSRAIALQDYLQSIGVEYGQKSECLYQYREDRLLLHRCAYYPRLQP